MGEEKKGPFQLSSQHSLPGNRVKPQSFRGRGSSGNSLLEFALVLPLLFVLIINAVNFGGMLYAWICVSNAARTGADYMVRGGATVGSPGLPTGAAVSSVVTGDLQALPNKAPGAVVVCVCTDNNGTTSRYPPGCAGVPEADPEPTYFVSGSVDVTYTYVPFIPLWSFPKLGISATLPPTTIHRQASARLLQ
jgi:Flp pilus assembly protein TadG